jgi:hypothetical protein
LRTVPGGEGCAFGDFIDRGAACREFQDVGFARGERTVADADAVGGEFGVDVAAATRPRIKRSQPAHRPT